MTDERRLTSDERLRRWRLILGGAASNSAALDAKDAAIDSTLAAVYDEAKSGPRGASLASSVPYASRWLGDIRTYFPASVVQVMQRDAFERLGIQRMLVEPELLRSIQPDVPLVGTLLSLSRIMPETTRETARMVIRQVVDDLERRLGGPLRQAVTGALNRAARSRRPRTSDIDWDRTIRANLKNYQPEYKTVIPERRIGYARRGQALCDVILCIDQSGSMASSVVYSAVMGAALASIRTVRTSLVVFDTSVVDLTDELQDPVDVLFGTQLGGGTDINLALTYCQGLVRTPAETIFVLISDLIEGGDQAAMIQRAASLVESGVNFIALRALDDKGAPVSDHSVASALAGHNIPCFACTPDLFPELMAAAIGRKDISRWAAERGIVTARAGG